MKRWLLAAVVALPLVGWADGPAKDPITGGDVQAGAAKGATCVACHGPGGNGAINPAWPKLAAQGSGYIYNQLKLFKSGQREQPIMQAQASALSDDDMRNVAAFFASQPPVPGVAAANAVASAQQLYRAGDPANGIPACQACHGPEGLGNPAAAYPRLSGQNPTYTAGELQLYRSGTRNKDKGSIMSAVATHLTDAQIQALSSYLAGLR